MSRQSGILAVNRFEFLRVARKTGALAGLKPAVDTSTEEAIRRYRGFDGLAWPDQEDGALRLEEGLAAIKDWPIVNRYIQNLPNASEWDVILLSRLGPTRESVRPADWSHAGFDVGYFQSQWSHFSVILNEVVFGIHPELRLFASRLNEHLLLSSLESASELIAERKRLAGAGKDLEAVMRLETFAVLLPE